VSVTVDCHSCECDSRLSFCECDLLTVTLVSVAVDCASCECNCSMSLLSRRCHSCVTTLTLTTLTLTTLTLTTLTLTTVTLTRITLPYGPTTLESPTPCVTRVTDRAPHFPCVAVCCSILQCVLQCVVLIEPHMFRMRPSSHDIHPRLIEPPMLRMRLICDECHVMNVM